MLTAGVCNFWEPSVRLYGSNSTHHRCFFSVPLPLFDSCFILFLFYLLLAVYAVVDNAGRAVMSAIVSDFHHLWGHTHASTFVEQPLGHTLSLK